MKITKIKHTLVAGILVATLGSCTKDYITNEPKGQFLSENYYANKDQAYAGLIAAYDVLGKNSGGFDNMTTMMNAGSDDHYAGGGGPSDGLGIHSFSHYVMDGNSSQDVIGLWSTHYQGIYRTNVLLQKLPAVPMDGNLIVRYTAEAKAIRALCYFNLVRMYKNVPLILTPLTTSEMYSVTQANPAEVYAQIEADLLDAIDGLPNTLATEERGRFTKGAAQALLGKVYLYDGKNVLAAEQLAEVNGTPGATNQYGNHLLSNFNDLWITSNKFNSESLLEASHTNTGNASWNGVSWGTEGNIVNVMVGPRGYVQFGSAPLLPSGWSFNVITQDLVDAMSSDPRFSATIFDIHPYEAIAQAQSSLNHAYIPGDEDTGYFLNKFLPRQADITPGTGDAVLNYQQDTYIIRLADTYLLEAEALGGTGTRAQALLDAVRARVGLPSVPVSMAAIKAERRLELAGEGHRFFDLVRWGDAASKLAGKGFVAGKNEIFPIPYKELENTQLIQNPGYN